MQFKDFLRSEQLAIINNMHGIGVPVLAGAEVGNVAANNLVITFSEDLNDTITPANGDFTVNDGSSNPVTNVAISGSQVTLTLTNNVTTGLTVIVSYTQGTNILQDLTGVEVDNFTNISVTNNT